MEEQLTHLQSEIEDMKTLRDSITKLLTENILQKKLIDDLDQQTRNHNLRITGLLVHPIMAVDEIITFVKEKLKDIEVTAADISNMTILKKPAANQDHSQSAPKTPTLIVTFQRRAIRDKILRGRRNLKGTHMSIWSWNGKIYFTTAKGGTKRTANPFLSLDDQLEA